MPASVPSVFSFWRNFRSRWTQLFCTIFIRKHYNCWLIWNFFVDGWCFCLLNKHFRLAVESILLFRGEQWFHWVSGNLHNHNYLSKKTISIISKCITITIPTTHRLTSLRWYNYSQTIPLSYQLASGMSNQAHLSKLFLKSF